MEDIAAKIAILATNFPELYLGLTLYFPTNKTVKIIKRIKSIKVSHVSQDIKKYPHTPGDTRLLLTSGLYRWPWNFTKSCASARGLYRQST